MYGENGEYFIDRASLCKCTALYRNHLEIVEIN